MREIGEVCDLTLLFLLPPSLPSILPRLSLTMFLLLFLLSLVHHSHSLFCHLPFINMAPFRHQQHYSSISLPSLPPFLISSATLYSFPFLPSVPPFLPSSLPPLLPPVLYTPSPSLLRSFHCNPRERWMEGQRKGRRGRGRACLFSPPPGLQSSESCRRPSSPPPPHTPPTPRAALSSGVDTPPLDRQEEGG